MFVKPMPHDGYTNAVAWRLADYGWPPKQWWTETPDGEQLDAVISFENGLDPELWPDGVYLGWDQRAGWSLCDRGTRELMPLCLDVYASPETVAVRTKTRLEGIPDVDVDENWDGAGALAEAVLTWERDGA